MSQIELCENGCCWDYLLLRDGNSESATELDRFCGDGTPPIITSSGNNMWIKFHSDGSVTKPGFSASVSYSDTPPTTESTTTVSGGCGGSFTDVTSGEFTSPNHPQDYNNNEDCVWTITAPLNQIITLTFNSFTVSNNPSKYYDFTLVLCFSLSHSFPATMITS